MQKGFIEQVICELSMVWFGYIQSKHDSGSDQGSIKFYYPCQFELSVLYVWSERFTLNQTTPAAISNMHT